jgi:PAS domain S-box-containing protein
MPLPSEIDYTSKDFFAAVLDRMPNLVFVKDEFLRFTYVNSALAEIFGTTREQVLGKIDADFIKDLDQVEHFKNDDRTVLLTRKPMMISEEFLSDANGKLHRLATLKVPFFWGAGKPHVLGLATDITSISAGPVEHDAIRFAVMSDMAHVIKTPIASAVFNLNEMYKEIGRNKLRSKSIWMASQRSMRFDRLEANIAFIRQSLLAISINTRTFAAIAQTFYSKPENRKPSGRLITQLMQEQINELTALMPSARLKYDCDSRLLACRVLLDATDMSLIKTAIYNIIYNSIKFSKADSPINVSLKLVDKTAVLTIEDFGTGIRPEDLLRIFDAGFTRKAIGYSAGTGMGLTIAKETFRRVGWAISVDSTFKVGTVVTIRIPLDHES